MPGHTTPSKPTIKDRAREEIRNYAIVAAYLYVCFGALLMYKVALLRQEGVTFVWHGIAAAKALILGKFLLLGEAAGVGGRARRSARLLVHAIVMRAVLLFVLLLVLSVIEEIVVGWAHGQPLAHTMGELTAHTWVQLLAGGTLMLLVLLPLVAAREIELVLGPGTLRELLFSAPETRAGAATTITDEPR